MQSTKNFQSYLFIGSNHQERLKNIENLLKSIGGNMNSNSPDLVVLEPVKTTIGIEQIRDLKKRVFQTPSVEKFNTILIKQADKLTPEAQNSLLKLIEEPPQKAIIILEGENKALFLPTILSRVVTHHSKVQTKNNQTPSDEIAPISLLDISEISQPKEWINDQIKNRYYYLISHLQNTSSQTSTIEKLAYVKKMINANVNPKLSLANFVLNLENN